MLDECAKIRIDVLRMVFASREGHLPSAFSIVETLYAVYANKHEHDVFFLSKGHAGAALFATLAHFGILEKQELLSYCAYDSRLGGHPHRTVPGVMNSSGSLWHGFPVAAGYAFSRKIKHEPGEVFCLIGDGESNEGTIWETAMYAEQLHLSNFVCIIDKNNSQVRAMTSIHLPAKFESFGWEVREVDGHSVEELKRVLFEPHEKPLCVIANTKKGKGVRELEENFMAWHHKAPGADEYEKFRAEILSQSDSNAL